jgi:hypothetical protein
VPIGIITILGTIIVGIAGIVGTLGIIVGVVIAGGMVGTLGITLIGMAAGTAHIGIIAGIILIGMVEVGAILIGIQVGATVGT